MKRFLRKALPALTPHTITTRRAFARSSSSSAPGGYATTVDELEEGLSGVSVGIFGESGTR